VYCNATGDVEYQPLPQLRIPDELSFEHVCLELAGEKLSNVIHIPFAGARTSKEGSATRSPAQVR
jgi:hypothetical protein